MNAATMTMNDKEQTPWWLFLLAAAIVAQVLLTTRDAKADTLTLPAAVPVDAGSLGTLKVQGMLSGLATAQSDATTADQSNRFDVDQAQLIVQKDEGMVRFLVQGGAYTFPVVGVPFTDTPDVVKNFYGPVPVAYLKLVPSDSMSLQLGKLTTLVGAEGAWPWGNYDIERGQLWNIENTVTRGAQFNYSSGALNLSLAWTDGFYSHRFNNLTGLVSYALTPSDALAAVVYDTLGTTPYDSSAAPVALNNGRIFNIIYVHTSGDWTFVSYIQHNQSPASSELGFTQSNDVWGVALLADYAINKQWSLGMRMEDVSSSGDDNLSPNNNLLGYGPGSRVWTLTMTPTWQSGGLFARAEVSYAHLNRYALGLGFGKAGDQADQTRLLLETGLVF